MNRIKSQKALGLQAFHTWAINYSDIEVPPFVIIKVTSTPPYGYFVRPCPTRPRHGFIESRVVNTKKEWRAICKETLAEDSEAEFICMEYIDTSHSVVITPTTLTIGLGNDGATAGRVGTVTMAVPIMTLPYYLLEAAQIREDWYIEGLTPRYVVQLRDGPSITSSKEYIPEVTVVKGFIASNEVTDLLKWEQMVKRLPKGTVFISHSVTSHAAVHAILNGVPVLTRDVKIGEILEPTSHDVTSWDKRAFYAGVHNALNDKSDSRAAAWFAYLVIHTANQQSSLYLGYAVGYLLRVIATACAGEGRYCEIATEKNDRKYVYNRVYNEASVPQVLAECISIFTRNNWESGYGGEAWEAAARLALNTWKRIEWGYAPKDVLGAANNALNAAHNGGQCIIEKMAERDPDCIETAPHILVGEATGLYTLLTRIRRRKRPARPSTYVLTFKPLWEDSWGADG